ncbi:type II toxin-antitoxin system VapC family toxin [Bosea vestrisii]|uniref:type II toxin-antitoxin system VapC family toxin n=1 Tax=Bosea vestrisii TaxID=151416 RepID=UPI0024DF9919|nr:type II toxin-antitoxin system VapC family toxin [Bosea vestrisii]WID98235.1 type II toxin-antitoxin system VapC family toxin [Bosea vestrisii]
MIVVDTSALMAIVLDEPEAKRCMTALAEEPNLSISAVTIAEALIVAERRGVQAEMTDLLGGLGFAVETADLSTAHGVADAYRAWGKGVAPAGLNFGDCFSYQLARQHDCPLLFVGDDFTRTDIVVAGKAGPG